MIGWNEIICNWQTNYVEWNNVFETLPAQEAALIVTTVSIFYRSKSWKIHQISTKKDLNVQIYVYKMIIMWFKKT